MSTVLVYSDDPAVRERVRIAVGRRPDPSLDAIEWLEANDGGALMTRVDEGGVDVCVLDGEAAPEGGMGVSRQLKNEIADCPAVLLLIMRKDDHWLARWSQCDATVRMPIDPVELTQTLVGLLRARVKALPAPAAGDELAHRH